jgi:hypothetical protein
MKIVTFFYPRAAGLFADCPFIPLNGTTLIAAAGNVSSAFCDSPPALSLHAHITKKMSG